MNLKEIKNEIEKATSDQMSHNSEVTSIKDVISVSKQFATIHKQKLAELSRRLSLRSTDFPIIGSFNFKEKSLKIIFKSNSDALFDLDSKTYNKLFDEFGPKELILKKDEKEGLYILHSDDPDVSKNLLNSSYDILDEIYEHFLSAENFLNHSIIGLPSANCSFPIDINRYYIAIGNMDTCGFEIKLFIKNNKTTINSSDPKITEYLTENLGDLTKKLLVNIKDCPDSLQNKRE